MVKEKKKRVRRPKHTITEIRAEFKKVGCTLLTKEYRSSKQRLRYKCKCGKVSVTCWNNFYRQSFNCKDCAIKSRLKPVPKRIILRDRIFCLAEAARYLNVRYDDLRKHIFDWKTLPGPSKKFGAKRYFTQEDLDKIESLIE